MDKNYGLAGAVIIPSSVTNSSVTYTVTSIGNNAFDNAYASNDLTSITIPNSVTIIGQNAFNKCTSLTSIDIPNSVTEIYSWAFNSCTGLTSVSIPNLLKTISQGTFYSCSGLTSVNIPNSVTSIENRAFEGCIKLTSIHIPNSVKRIEGETFVFCKNLKSINLPNLINSIELELFLGCTSLTSVSIPNSVSSIERNAFANCSSLTTVTVNWATPLVINANVFGVVDIQNPSTSKPVPLASATLYVPAGTKAAYQAAPVWKEFGTIIEMQTFTYQGINYKVTSPTTVEVGLNSDFVGDAVIPSSVTNAGVVYEVTRIGDYAFSNSYSNQQDVPIGLTSIIIPNSITSIGYGAFYGSIRLTSVNIPSLVTIIEDEVFRFCVRLKSVNLPTGIISIGTGAFNLCYDLESINIPNTVKTIKPGAFDGCSSLISIIIPNSVTTIGYNAFIFCSGLTSVSIPNSVSSIDYKAFGICVALKSVTVNWATPLVIDVNVFDAVPMASATLYVPAGTKAAYKAAPVWKDFGTILEMQPITFTYQGINFKTTSPTTVEIAANPSFTGVLNILSSVTYVGITYDVTSITNNAFAGSGITTINIPNSVTNIGDYAFANLTELTAVTVNWASPILINATVFGDVPPIPLVKLNALKSSMATPVLLAKTNITSATLYVPAGTLAAYKAAAVWQDFNPITEGVLPLTLTSLTAKAIPTGNQINWVTANILNVKNIILERSGADNTFSPLATLPLTATQYIDTNPLAGDNYYRLSTIDNDGRTKTYTQIALVKGLSNDIAFYPNPITNGVLNVVAGSAKLQSVTFFDLNGKKVVRVNSLNNYNKVAISTQGLAKGVYVIEISSHKGKLIKKVVVN